MTTARSKIATMAAAASGVICFAGWVVIVQEIRDIEFADSGG